MILGRFFFPEFKETIFLYKIEEKKFCSKI